MHIPGTNYLAGTMSSSNLTIWDYTTYNFISYPKKFYHYKLETKNSASTNIIQGLRYVSADYFVCY